MTSAMALRCPKCAGEMASYDRSGINVEQCRECRGIFLDRGELERLVDAEGGAWVGPTPGVPAGVTHAAPPPVRPAGYPPVAPPRHNSRQHVGYRSEWHSDDEDRHNRHESRGSNGRPSKRAVVPRVLLEGFAD